MVKSLIGRLVQRAQFHVGYGETARTGCHAKKDNAHMELTPPGVFITTAKGEDYLVPYSNVVWCHLEKDGETASAG